MKHSPNISGRDKRKLTQLKQICYKYVDKKNYRYFDLTSIAKGCQLKSKQAYNTRISPHEDLVFDQLVHINTGSLHIKHFVPSKIII